jgi:hypothetical protein
MDLENLKRFVAVLKGTKPNESICETEEKM